MIGFNHILQLVGIDLARARLVRHQDARATVSRSPYDLWRADKAQFDLYQRIQGKPRFKDTDWVISFVATPLDETLFAGVYVVRGVGAVPPGTIDPCHGHDVEGLLLYDLKQDDALSDYAGRIVIDWGKAYRSWVQRPHRQDKAVLEIRRSAAEPPFPGFTSFSWPLGQLSAVPSSWRGALSAVSGVYLLACRSTGRQYVGSAYGVGGFWARWESYLQTGSGGNEGMKLNPHNDYQVSVLEFASSSLQVDDIVRMEGRWKDKLLTRKFGLNRN